MLDKAAILNSKRPTKVITVPEWGGNVTVRSFSGRDLVALQKEVGEKGDSDDPMDKVFCAAKVIQMSVITADGRLMFSEEDIPALCDQPLNALLKLAQEIYQHNGLTQAAVEDTEKN